MKMMLKTTFPSILNLFSNIAFDTNDTYSLCYSRNGFWRLLEFWELLDFSHVSRYCDKWKTDAHSAKDDGIGLRQAFIYQFSYLEDSIKNAHHKKYFEFGEKLKPVVFKIGHLMLLQSINFK